MTTTEAFETHYQCLANDPAHTDMKAFAKAVWDAATERAAKQEPEKLPIRLHVSFAPGDWDTFFYGVSGKLTMEALTEIDASLRDADSGALFDKGAGEYLLGASYFPGQYGFEGRCEIEPGWEVWVESFVPHAAAIRAAGGAK